VLIKSKYGSALKKIAIPTFSEGCVGWLLLLIPKEAEANRSLWMNFEASLVYRVNSRTARPTEKPCLENKTKQNKTKKQKQKQKKEHLLLLWGWSDGSEVKSTDCSSRGPEFKSQQPHGGSQPSVI
jgi:hypothetical protein